MNRTAPTATAVTAAPRLDHAESGDAAGPAVVLLHGLSDSRRSYRLLARHLPSWMHLFAVSQRGHGDSDRPSTGYTPADMADDVNRFLDDKGLASAVIVGHSMGSVVAQRFAIDHPERTDALGLIGAFAPLRDPAFVDEVDAMFGSLVDPVPESFIRNFQASSLALPVPTDFFEDVIAESAKLPAHVWAAAWAGIRDTDLTLELPHISAPTLLVWGNRDAYASREMQERLLAAIPDARLRTYRNVGHTPHWEQPARVAVDLAAFVSDALSLAVAS